MILRHIVLPINHFRAKFREIYFYEGNDATSLFYPIQDIKVFYVHKIPYWLLIAI